MPSSSFACIDCVEGVWCNLSALLSPHWHHILADIEITEEIRVHRPYVVYTCYAWRVRPLFTFTTALLAFVTLTVSLSEVQWKETQINLYIFTNRENENISISCVCVCACVQGALWIDTQRLLHMHTHIEYAMEKLCERQKRTKRAKKDWRKWKWTNQKKLLTRP